MKSIIVSLAVTVVLAAGALGIPQTFNQGVFPGNVFLLRNGVAFEQVAGDPANWAKAADLTGRWAKRGATTLVLEDAAVVFGVPADEITAERSGDAVQSMRVVFHEKAAKGGAGKAPDLLAQVTANVRAFTGDDGAGAKGGGTVFKHKTLTITVRRGKAREVIAEFARAA